MKRTAKDFSDMTMKRMEFKVDESGKVSASIATFGMEDHDGDIVEKTAFTDGQEVAMVWSHDWDRPIGKGVIHVMATEAVFEGAFFLDTADGAEAYKTVKAMGSLQEWSWGFRVTKRLIEETDNGWIRHIQEAEVYEVSPVLKGAGIGTRTLAIKGKNSLDAEVKTVKEAVVSLGERVRSVKGMRAEDGRDLSKERKEELKALADDLRETAKQLDELLAPAADVKAEALKEHAKYLKSVSILEMGKDN